MTTLCCNLCKHEWDSTVLTACPKCGARARPLLISRNDREDMDALFSKKPDKDGVFWAKTEQAIIKRMSDLVTLVDLQTQNERLKVIITEREQVIDTLKEALNKVLNSGHWYTSALEFDCDIDGNELENEIKPLCKPTDAK